MKGFGMNSLTRSLSASAFLCQDGSVRFCQIVGRTYRGETLAVMSARNVFIAFFPFFLFFFKLDMIRPTQTFRPSGHIKCFRTAKRCLQVWVVGFIIFNCSCNYRCQPNLGLECVYKPKDFAAGLQDIVRDGEKNGWR